MKKILIPLITLILFIPCIVNAETCENDKVYIDSISLDKNTNVDELEEATASGKNIDLSLAMSNVGDNIRYKIVVKNDSNEDYILDKNSINISSKYIDYTIESDNSNIVKAKSSKTIYLRVNYSHQVPADAYEGGIVKDEINMKVNLSTENLSNPNTGIKYILFISLVVLVMIGMFIIFKKKRLSKVMIFIICLSMFIPISAYALCKCDISINSTVVILEEPFSGTIYRTSYDELEEGSSLKKEFGWFIIEKETNEYSSFSLETKQECENIINDAISNGYINEGEYFCKVTIGGKNIEYTLNPNELNNPFYIKDTVVNNKVTKAEVCFVTDKEVCFTKSTSENYNLLLNEENWFNSNGGSCNFNDDEATCEIEDIMEVVIDYEFNQSYVHKKGVLGCNEYFCYYDGK